MRVLVTGGAGYIGSVVTEQLIQDGNQVVVYDNLSKGHREAVVAGAEFVEGELSDPSTLKQTLHERKIEAVIHMAASSLVGESVEHPNKYYQNNVIAGLTLLDAMLACDVKRLVFSSTAATYGEPETQPIEESAPTNPTNTYGETKLAFEHALRSTCWMAKRIVRARASRRSPASVARRSGRRSITPTTCGTSTIS
jgi:UDP-glucose 4-epimerase